MPLTFAFKITAGWEVHESVMDYELDKEISRVTGSPYCHVEAWIMLPVHGAACFSSRNPTGTSIASIDLSDPSRWNLISIPTKPDEDDMIRGFSEGSSGRKYDEFGILGIGLGTTFHDPYDRICSESCFEIASLVISFPSEIKRWMVAPGGPTIPGKRYGLYELLTALP